MHRWTVGEVEIIRIEDLDFALPSGRSMPEWAIPSFAPSPDEFRVAFSALAIRDGSTRIVVDPWLQAQRDAPDAQQTAARLLGELDAAGWPADQVDVVINSHLDGLGWNSVPGADGWRLAFPEARHLYPAEDVAAAGAGEPILGGEDLLQLMMLTDVTQVGESFQVTDSVRIERTLGHGYGHQVVRIENGGEMAIYLGHLVIQATQFPYPDVSEDEHPETSIGLRHTYLGELADRGGLALTTLVGGAGGGTVDRSGDGYQITPSG